MAIKNKKQDQRAQEPLQTEVKFSGGRSVITINAAKITRRADEEGARREAVKTEKVKRAAQEAANYVACVAQNAD